ncbi:MAG: hypothetical protein HeimC2_13000 [Candidatus Heimdallarchaeota archaeon LC_2]|nr:MAG: hypothetical protein HeimC2_13000 [Candidatus Heimdallarchaeota archaeon LC_2]
MIIISNFILDFFSTIGILVLAEFADKTNLVALSLMIKTQKPFSVAFGGMIGIAIVTLFGVIVGVLIGDSLPLRFVPIVAGSVFIWIGLSELLENNDESEKESESELKSKEMQVTRKSDIIINSFILIGLAEFGDKSQIFVITRAIEGDPLAILLGAIIGMGIVMFATAYFGEILIEKLPEEQIHKYAHYGFVIAGFLILGSGIYNFILT